MSSFTHPVTLVVAYYPDAASADRGFEAITRLDAPASIGMLDAALFTVEETIGRLAMIASTDSSSGRPSVLAAVFPPAVLSINPRGHAPAAIRWRDAVGGALGETCDRARFASRLEDASARPPVARPPGAPLE